LAGILVAALVLVSCGPNAAEPLPESEWKPPPRVPYTPGGPPTIAATGPANVTLAPPKKIVVLGLDGASWDVLRPLLAEGRMPNLQTFLGRAAYGLLATDEALSPVSWTSIATGKTKAKHGITYDLPTATLWGGSGCVVRSARLWDLLAKKYPRQAVLRWHFPPLDDGSDRLVFVDLHRPDQPPALRALIDRALADDSSTNDALPSSLRVEAQEVSVIGRIVGRVDRDFSASILRLTDDLIHFCLLPFHLTETIGRENVRLYSAAADGFDARVAAYRKAYRRVDDVIGTFSAPAWRDALVVLASDHGSAPWLGEPATVTPSETFLRKLGAEGGIAFTPGEGTEGGYAPATATVPLRVGGVLPGNIVATRRLYRIPSYTDRTTGTAYFQHLDVPDLAFTLSRPDRAAIGDLETAMRGLGLLGKPLYACTRTGDARLDCRLTRAALAAANTFNLPAFDPPDSLAVTVIVGEHPASVAGIFAVAGPNVMAGKVVAGASLFDVLPTVCALADVATPEDVDGRVLVGAIAPEFLEKHPARRGEAVPSPVCDEKRQPAPSLPPGVLEALKRLGYVR
jgi:hypothetical protein